MHMTALSWARGIEPGLHTWPFPSLFFLRKGAVPVARAVLKGCRAAGVLLGAEVQHVHDEAIACWLRLNPWGPRGGGAKNQVVE